MTDAEYRAFLDLFMCSDPWPVQPPNGHDVLERYADQQAQARGYANWIVAYHEMSVLVPSG